MPASFILTSSIDFCPKLRMSSRSASVRAMSSPTELMPSRLRQLYEPDGQVQLLDRQRQIGGQLSVLRGRADVDALGALVQLPGQAEQLDQGGAGAGQRGARRDRRLRLDVDDEPVEVGALLDRVASTR
jgi:hypothetical protein